MGLVPCRVQINCRVLRPNFTSFPSEARSLSVHDSKHSDDKKLLEDDKQPDDVRNEESGWDDEEEFSNDTNRQDQNISCDFGGTDETKELDSRKQRDQTPRGGERTTGTSSYAKARSRNDVNLESEETDYVLE